MRTRTSKTGKRRVIMTSNGNKSRPARRGKGKGKGEDGHNGERTAKHDSGNNHNKKIEQSLLSQLTGLLVFNNFTIYRYEC